jgi:hypothetical protein
MSAAQLSLLADGHERLLSCSREKAPFQAPFLCLASRGKSSSTNVLHAFSRYPEHPS